MDKREVLLSVSDRLVFGKAVENLVEITLAFSGLAHGHRLTDICESLEWKYKFVDWANEFEELHGEEDWNSGENGDYYEEIEKFAQGKILETEDSRQQQPDEGRERMDEKKMDLSIADKLGTVMALINTARIAIGNQEFFLEDGQGVAVTLDIAGAELSNCRRVLETVLQK